MLKHIFRRNKSHTHPLLRGRCVRRAQFLIAVSVLTNATITAAAAAQTPVMFSAALPRGAHAVGFHREWILDSTRGWAFADSVPAAQRHQGRPLRLDVWYPAGSAASCRPATLRDYLFPTPPDRFFASSNRWLVRADSGSYANFASGMHIPLDSMLALRSMSCMDAAPAGGSYPLIVYSGGWYNRSPDNVGLGEYLASYGFVVVEVPLLGAGLWTHDFSYSTEALDTQERDMEAALRAVSSHGWVDRTHVAVMGYSGGGIIALLTGLRNPNVRGVIGLDPSYMGNPDLIFGAPYFGLDRSKAPLLTLRSGNAAFANRVRSAVIDSLRHIDRYTADVGNGSHGDFGDDVLIELAARLQRPAEPRSTAEGIAAYRAMANAIRLFANATLKGNAVAIDSMLASDTSLRWIRQRRQ